MTLQKASDLQTKQQNSRKQQNAQPQKTDKKDAGAIQHMNQPNHPNT